jgi:uncharacterized protein YaaW (UPF0174 family)
LIPTFAKSQRWVTRPLTAPRYRNMPSDELEARKLAVTKSASELTTTTSLIAPTAALVSAGTGPLPLIEDDEDLVPLLRQASNEELAPLVKYIVEKGSLTAQLHRTRAYKQYSGAGDHHMYADDIAAEIQKFGANTFYSHLFRDGRGKKYRKILGSVAKRCRVKAHLWHETAKVEELVLAAVLSKAYERMTDEQRKEVLESLKIHKVPGGGGPLTAAALQAAVQAAGFAPYKIAVIVANGMANAVLGHGLAFAANAGLTKLLALFAGPIGWALDAMWGGVIVAGPAYRVTIPCVVQVAFIRQSLLSRERERKLRKLRTLKIVLSAILALVIAILIARYFIK